MGNNLEFHKMTFWVQPLFCWKFGFRIVNNCMTLQVTETYESLKEHQKNNLETEMWKCVGRILLERHF